MSPKQVMQQSIVPSAPLQLCVVEGSLPCFQKIVKNMNNQRPDKNVVGERQKAFAYIASQQQHQQ